MSRKVEITQQQADAIEWLLEDTGEEDHWTPEDLVKEHMKADKDWCGIAKAINGMRVTRLMSAVYDGYEVTDIHQGDCETCQGEGRVFQESGAGNHATANMGWVECPDCEGKGKHDHAATSGTY